MLPCFIRTLLVSAATATVLFGLVLFVDPEPAFADRWTGSCTGWTKPLALVHSISDVLMFLAYVGVAVSIGLYHPRMDRIRNSRLTVALVSATFAACACSHLVDAISAFHPAYRIGGIFKMTAAAVAVVGWWFITLDLKAVQGVVHRDRMRLETMDRQLGAAEQTRHELSNRASPNGKG